VLGTEREGVTDSASTSPVLKGFPVGTEIRRGLAMGVLLNELDTYFHPPHPTPVPVDHPRQAARPPQSPGRSRPVRLAHDRTTTTVPAGPRWRIRG